MILTQAVIVLLCFGVPWSIAVAAVPEGWRPGVTLAGLAALAALLWRAGRISVSLSEAGITVKNYWRTHRLAWKEVAEVCGAYQAIGAAPTPVIAFKRRDGVTIKALASAVRDRKKRQLVLELKNRPELTAATFNLPPRLLAQP